jgi:hypothetical protein
MKYIKSILGVILFTAIGVYILGLFVDSETNESTTKDSVVEETKESKVPTEPIETTNEEPETSEKSSFKNRYDTMKANYDLLGRWEIYNEFIDYTFFYEIYKQGDEYKMATIYTDEETKQIDIGADQNGIESVRVDGNNYYPEEMYNEDSEYLVIDTNKNLSLFSPDGELDEEWGYKITKR